MGLRSEPFVLDAGPSRGTFFGPGIPPQPFPVKQSGLVILLFLPLSTPLSPAVSLAYPSPPFLTTFNTAACVAS